MIWSIKKVEYNHTTLRVTVNSFFQVHQKQDIYQECKSHKTNLFNEWQIVMNTQSLNILHVNILVWCISQIFWYLSLNANFFTIRSYRSSLKTSIFISNYDIYIVSSHDKWKLSDCVYVSKSDICEYKNSW